MSYISHGKLRGLAVASILQSSSVFWVDRLLEMFPHSFFMYRTDSGLISIIHQRDVGPPTSDATFRIPLSMKHMSSFLAVFDDDLFHVCKSKYGGSVYDILPDKLKPMYIMNQ